MSQPPLWIGAHDYRGFYDVRLVRLEGPPFTLRDLLRARRHCLWMGVVWRRLVAFATRSPGSVIISGFANGQGYELPEATPVVPPSKSE